MFTNLIRLACLGVVTALSVQAQTALNVQLTGSSYATNAAGDFMRTEVNNITILKEAAGSSDTNRFALAYHVNGSVFGDTIDIVDARTGAKLDWVYGFYYGEEQSFSRSALTNATGTVVRRVDYIYSKQSPYAQGSAFVVKKKTADNSNLRVEGRMQFMLRPEGRKPPRIYQLKFETTGPFQPAP